MNKKLLTKFCNKKEAYRRWKQEYAIQEEHRAVFQVCRDGVKKTKAHLVLNPARDMKRYKKGLDKCVNSRRKTSENANPLLSGAGALVTKDMKNAFFALVLNGETGLQESQAPETQEKVWSKEDLNPQWKTIVLGNTKTKQTQTSPWCLNRTQPQALKELADVIARPHPIIFERLW